MKKDNRISPVGLKGKEINKRMIELMGIKPINENHSSSVIELTKIGPDGNAYAIVRENHEYYIKMTPKTSRLVTEDFNYIGGLQNKKSEAYPSYAKAIKHLNLKFNSLAESFDKGHNINVFENDNLLNENGLAGGFANHPRGGGFSGEGNLEGNKPMWENEVEEHIYDIKSLKELKKYKNFSKGRKIVKTVKFGEPYILLIDNNEQIQYYFAMDDDGTLTFQAEEEFYDDGTLYENIEKKSELNEGEKGGISPLKVMKSRAGYYVGRSDSSYGVEVPYSRDSEYFATSEEAEAHLNRINMSEGKKEDNPWAICTASVGREDKAKYEACVMDVKKEKGIKEEVTENQYCGLEELTEIEQAVDDMTKEKPEKEEEKINEHKLSIARAIVSMDNIIDSLTEGKVKKKVYSVK